MINSETYAFELYGMNFEHRTWTWKLANHPIQKKWCWTVDHGFMLTTSNVALNNQLQEPWNNKPQIHFSKRRCKRQHLETGTKETLPENTHEIHTSQTVPQQSIRNHSQQKTLIFIYGYLLLKQTNAKNLPMQEIVLRQTHTQNTCIDHRDLSQGNKAAPEAGISKQLSYAILLDLVLSTN